MNPVWVLNMYWHKAKMYAHHMADEAGTIVINLNYVEFVCMTFPVM